MMRRGLLLLASLCVAAGCVDPNANVYCKGDEHGCPSDDPDPAIPPPPPPQPDGCKGEDISKQTPHDRMLNCAKCSPDFSFELSGVLVCGVKDPPKVDPPQPTPTPEEPPALDLAKFEEYMRLRDGETVGYAWGLVDTRPGFPRLAASGASGFATLTGDAAGGGTRMTPMTLANVGSTTKVLGGVSLIHVFEKLDAAKNPSSISLDRFLATPFLYFLPRPAKLKADPSLATITIGSLLQHRSGLRLNTSQSPEKDLKNLLQEKVTPEEQAEREYNNMGLVIARYLITFLSDPNKRVALEQNETISADELSAEVDKVTRSYYANFLATTMKNAVGDDFTSTCYAAELNGAAQMFDNAVDRNGHIYSSKPWGGCSTQGGNWTSVDDWAKFFVAFRNDKLISARARHLMSNHDEAFGANGEGRLIWSRYNSMGDGTQSPWLQTNYQVGSFFGHGGDHPREVDGVEYHAHAAVIELLWGYYGVAIVNSREMGSSTLMLQLKNAFAAALGWTP